MSCTRPPGSGNWIGSGVWIHWGEYDMTTRLKRGLRWLLFTRPGNRRLLFVPLALVILAVLFLRFGLSILPDCLFFEATGLHCPGCGGIRATLSLLEGDVPSAIYYNPLIVAFYLLLAVWYLLFCWNALFRRQYRRPFAFSPWQGYLFLGVVLLFWVVRNCPFYTAVLF